MYLNKKRHYLSKSILLVALIKIVVTIVFAGFRILLRKYSTAAPDMLENRYWFVQQLSSGIKIISTGIIFYMAWIRLQHDIAVIPAEDREDIRSLQLEYFHGDLPALSAGSISKLLQLWTVIFVGSELIYAFTSLMYRRFIATLMNALALGDGSSSGVFILLYNMTHGFKYLQLLTGLLLGVVATGIFLKDDLLKYMSLAIVVLFLLAFGLFEMQTVLFMGKAIGIVWTSVICHLTETAGLIAFAIYLAREYKGL
jgi:hypothetical protein